MRKIIIALMFAAGNLFAQAGNTFFNLHDSLLFDGAGEVFDIIVGKEKSCWKVKHIWGTVTGTKDTAVKYEYACGFKKQEGVEFVTRQIRGALKENMVLYEDDLIELEEGSIIQIELTDVRHHLILTATGVENFKVPSCDKNNFKWEKVKRGKYFWESTDWNLQYIETPSAKYINLGTKYSLETSDNEDILKVYEGSVEIQPRKYNTDMAAEITQLQLDYQNGKITLEELTVKMKELAPQVKKESEYVSKKHIIDAGFQVTVTDGRIGDAVPISQDDDRWWEK
jgi:hypothetical protein